MDAPRYNTIFTRLAGEEEAPDLVGLVAYGLYKSGKRDWIIRYRRKHDRSPDNLELDAYVDTLGDNELNRLRGEAESMMLRFAEAILESRIQQIKNEAISAHLNDRLTRIEKKSSAKGQFGWNVLAGICASFAVIILSVIIIAGLYSPGLVEIFTDILSISGSN